MSLNKRLFAGGIPPVENAFNVVTWSGTGSSQSITGLGFKPDLIWLKNRNNPTLHQHNLIDSTRTNGYTLHTNSTDVAESAGTNMITAIGTDGFTLGTDNAVNQNGYDYVAWCWRANEGTTSTNTDGSINSTVQANTDAGFSIINYTGDNGGIGGSGTVGHGLNGTPTFIIGKSINWANNWIVYLNDGSDHYHGYLDNDGALNVNSSNTQVGTPNATTIGLSHIGTNNNGYSFMYYAWQQLDGYSKFGSYTGTGSSGNAQNIGFEPGYVMIKSLAQYNWEIYDTKRPSGSITGRYMLLANATDTEYTTSAVHIDITSTGFSFPNSYDGTNKSSQKYIYMAFRTAN